jgi:hypothetical protein
MRHADPAYQQAVLAAGPPPDVDGASYPEDALAALAGEGGVGGVSQDGANQPQAVWRDAHPSARKWVEKRGASARTPKPLMIFAGLCVAGLGAYLMFIFLPSKAPLTAVERLQISQQAGAEIGWRFGDQLYTIARINAALFSVLGFALVLRGALNRVGSSGRKREGRAIMLLGATFAVLAICFLALLAKASLQ